MRESPSKIVGSALTSHLDKSPVHGAFVAAAASFCVYFCMYAFRKPFAAAAWADPDGGTSLKSALVIGQLVGYASAKFLAVRVCSELSRRWRAPFLAGLIVIAELALLLLALGSPALQIGAMFVNGLALGSVWGVVTRYLEGRRTSELLMAALSCSFIVSSGIVKDVGRWLMGLGVSESWMPAATGLLFLGPFLLFLWLVDRVPDPDDKDELDRNERTPMLAFERRRFFVEFLPGMLLLLATYLLLTIFRDYRDIFGLEIFAGLGYADEPAIFSRSELTVGFGIICTLALLALVRSHKAGLACSFGLMVFGTVLLGVSVPLLDAGWISGMEWMIVVGFGAYLAYVPFNSLLFERIMAATRFPGTAVFTICLADAVGYTGVIGMVAGKEILAAHTTPLEFFRGMTIVFSIATTLLCAIAGIYFVRRARPLPVEPS